MISVKSLTVEPIMDDGAVLRLVTKNEGHVSLSLTRDQLREICWAHARQIRALQKGGDAA